ncbi:hypothetical protein BJV78DRAFT_1311137 [Lactifluus subvellereus]|nr:hypothetical protein BJV78DRAFT_1311137 [Lactifluus subvellereus]
MIQGIENSQLSQVASFLPALFHLSIFLFLAGFVIFLFHVNHAIFWVILAGVAACVALYLYASLVPILKYDSPCYTPLFSLMSISLWWEFKFLYHLSRRLDFIGSDIRLRMLAYTRGLHRWTLRNMAKDVEDLARTHSSVLDTSVILQTFDSLDGDKDMERFLTCIPGFYCSSDVKKDVPTLEKFNGKRFPPAIVSFMNRSLSSELLTEAQKERRIAICGRAITADPLILQCTFRQVLQIPGSLIFNNLDFVRLAQSQVTNNDADPWVKDYARCIVAIAINRVHDYNNHWAVMVRHPLGLSQVRLMEYGRQGDYHSVQLRNLICTTQLLMASQLKDSDQFDRGGVWHNVLMEIRKLEILQTEDELQHKFCDLWNELMATASDQRVSQMRSNAMHILSVIHNLYIPVHRGPESTPFGPSWTTGDEGSVSHDTSSYTFCTVSSHHPHHPDLIASTSAGPSTRFPEPTLPSPLASHQSYPTRHVTYGTALGDVPDASQRTTQGTTDFPATSLTAHSDTYSTQAVATPIPLQVFVPSSSGTVTSISEAPGISPSFLLPTVPGHTPPVELDLFSSSPPSQFDQTFSVTAISPASSPLQANPNVADTDVPTLVGAPHDDPYQTAQSGPEVATDISLGTAPSPRDVDRPQ